jgi:hypothetical protein
LFNSIPLENDASFFQKTENKAILRYLKNCLLNCEVEKIDMNENHFSEWLSLSLVLILWEKELLS